MQNFFSELQELCISHVWIHQDLFVLGVFPCVCSVHIFKTQTVMRWKRGDQTCDLTVKEHVSTIITKESRRNYYNTAL